MKNLLFTLIALFVSLSCIAQVVAMARRVTIVTMADKELVWKTDSAKRAYIKGDTIVVPLINGKVKKFYPTSEYIYYIESAGYKYIVKE